jgi:hypothetical protein
MSGNCYFMQRIGVGQIVPEQIQRNSPMPHDSPEPQSGSNGLAIDQTPSDWCSNNLTPPDPELQPAGMPELLDRSGAKQSAQLHGKTHTVT